MRLALISTKCQVLRLIRHLRRSKPNAVLHRSNNLPGDGFHNAVVENFPQLAEAWRGKSVEGANMLVPNLAQASDAGKTRDKVAKRLRICAYEQVSP